MKSTVWLALLLATAASSGLAQPTVSQSVSLLKSAVSRHKKTVLDSNREKYHARYDANDYAIEGKYRFAFVDLNEDGIADAIIQFDDPDDCGTGGCLMEIYRGTANGFEFVSSSTITVPPIRVMAEKRYGWKSLIVGSGGTGNVVMRFNGSRYPLNPSLQPQASQSSVDASTTVNDWTK